MDHQITVWLAVKVIAGILGVETWLGHQKSLRAKSILAFVFFLSLAIILFSPDQLKPKEEK